MLVKKKKGGVLSKSTTRPSSPIDTLSSLKNKINEVISAYKTFKNDESAFNKSLKSPKSPKTETIKRRILFASSINYRKVLEEAKTLAISTGKTTDYIDKIILSIAKSLDKAAAKSLHKTAAKSLHKTAAKSSPNNFLKKELIKLFDRILLYDNDKEMIANMRSLHKLFKKDYDKKLFLESYLTIIKSFTKLKFRSRISRINFFQNFFYEFEKNDIDIEFERIKYLYTTLLIILTKLLVTDFSLETKIFTTIDQDLDRDPNPEIKSLPTILGHLHNVEALSISIISLIECVLGIEDKDEISFCDENILKEHLILLPCCKKIVIKSYFDSWIIKHGNNSCTNCGQLLSNRNYLLLIITPNNLNNTNYILFEDYIKSSPRQSSPRVFQQWWN